MSGAPGRLSGELPQFGVFRLAEVGFQRARVFAGEQRAFDLRAGEPVLTTASIDAK